jgi:hypothetical protein
LTYAASTSNVSPFSMKEVSGARDEDRLTRPHELAQDRARPREPQQEPMQWVVLDIGKKTDLPGPAAFRDCNSVLFLGDLEGLPEPRSIW